MKNTKLIKVSTADRLPETAGYYFTINRATGKQTGYFNRRSFAESFIDFEYWLEEIPDYEEEMREMLENIVSHFEDMADEYGLESTEKRSAIENAKSLLTKIKES